ncbi:MAG: ECF transporter S component [Oscillospiraceae bacterium]
MTKFRIISAAALVSVPLLAVAAAFGALRWDMAALLIAVLCCVPFLLAFEKRAPSAGELVLVACMTAFSAAGRFIFAPIPFFKPVTAIVVLAAMYFGAQAGFMTGALSAVISNIYFGQGAWTPFQMLCWGGIGFLAGVLNRRGLLEKTLPLCVFGAVSGVLYSAVMDVWTTLSADGAFNLARWVAAMVSALPITAVYAASNVVFLLVLKKPLGRQFRRLREKYGVFEK